MSTHKPEDYNRVIDTGNLRIGKELTEKLVRILGNKEFLLRRRRRPDGTTYVTVEVSFNALYDLWLASVRMSAGYARKAPPWKKS